MTTELLQQLRSRFPARLHKTRKLPGGGTYIYIPWDVIVDRLNDICGMDWSTEYSTPIVTGDYLSITCKLTIASVTRAGVGTIKTYPELNDEGKEKIIGDPPNNAARDAFADAAWMFGIARYLDNQTEAQKWLNEVNRLNAAMKQHKMSKEAILDLVEANFEKSSLDELEVHEYNSLIDLIPQAAKMQQAIRN